MNPAEVIMKKQQERDTLRNVVAQWNANRLDLFELSEPNEELEFHGVMRFYFQDSGQKVATKCIRVASDATSQAVIETLIEKFRPDMRMLSVPEYALYEIHENGDERRLGVDEKPLLVQLNWHIDDREGRFLLRRIDDVTNMPSVSFQEGGSSFRRKLSKREKKQLKKQEKLNKLKTTAVPDENDAGVAEKLYTELPETSFTRSISNPEAVMRRRRQQKLERKLQQFRSKDGGPDTGGTLKIYGEALCRDVPYKTLLLSVRDSAQQVVREMLAKYGLEKEQDPHNFCLVQVNTAIPVENGESKEYHGGTNNREYILDDDECPLAILMNHPSSRGSIMFHVRRRPADYHPRKRKKKLQGKWSKGSDLQEYRYEDSTGFNNLPFFLELNPDGSDILNGTPKRHRLHPNVTEVGSERPNNQSQVMQQNQSQSLQLFGPNVQPRHCVIGHTAGIVTVTPCSREAETYVNSQRIYETTILQNGAVVKFGRIHVFRFLDPNHDPDRTRQRHDSARQNLDFSYDRQSSRGDNEASGQQPSPNASTQNYETTFDVDGNVETVSTSSLKEETRSQRSVSSSNGNRLSNYERYPRGTDPILPAVLEFREETEEAFLHAIITDLDPSAPSFKLAPAYCLYLVARYRASTHYRPELTPTERAHRLTGLLARVAAIIHNVIQERYTDAKLLAFWMANSSELLHFLKCDRHISAFSLDAQDILAECVEISFRNLVSCLQGDLAAVMPHFMAKEDQTEEQQDSTGSVLQVLTLAMALLRRCRVNAALTIQLFSQLFHFINMWAFNKVVTSTSPNICYCTRAWGLRLKTKLAQLEVWAERQGLELAADCHLARIIQAAHLLQAPKYSPEDLATLSSTCFKLNSLQLRALLSKYQPTSEEPRLPHELIENVVRVAENVADELARSDGREIRLEEETELQLPFLLPEDGYSCDVVRGIPQGLAEFLAPLQHAGLCRMSAQPTSSGLWTIYMHQPQNPGARSPSAMSNRSGGYPPGHLQEPELQVIRLNKSNNGMGLSIVAAKGAGQDRLGIYIKSVVKGGAADADGQLQAGDQLLKVDGQSLVGITQERAAEYLVRTGPTVTLEVAKQGAIYHGLATLLQQPSPIMARASPATRSRPKSELIQPPLLSAGPLPSSTSMSNLRHANNVTPATFEERLVDWDVEPGRRRLQSDAFCRSSSPPPQSYHNSNVLLLDPRQLVTGLRSYRSERRPPCVVQTSAQLHSPTSYPHHYHPFDKRLQPPQNQSDSSSYNVAGDSVNPYSQPGRNFHARPTSLQIAGQSHRRLHPINQLKVGAYPYDKSPTYLAPPTHTFQIPHISVESFNPVASGFVKSPSSERRNSVYGSNSPNCDRRKCRDEKYVGSSFCGADIAMPSPMEIFKLGPKSDCETVDFDESTRCHDIGDNGQRKYTKLNLDSNQNTIGNTYGIFKSMENVDGGAECSNVCGVVLETDNSSVSSLISSGDCNETSSVCCCSSTNTDSTDSPDRRRQACAKQACGKTWQNPSALRQKRIADDPLEREEITSDEQDKLNKFLDVDEILLDELPNFECPKTATSLNLNAKRGSFVQSMLRSDSGGDNSSDSNDSTLNTLKTTLENSEHCRAARTLEQERKSIDSLLHLDLSGLADPDSSNSSEAATKCWRSPEEVRLGFGRVAALAKHFSLLGEGGLIRVRGGDRLHRSESDISPRRSAEKNRSPPGTDFVLLPRRSEVEPNPFNVMYALGLKAMSFSMDHLLANEDSDGPKIKDVTDELDGNVGRSKRTNVDEIRRLSNCSHGSNGSLNQDIDKVILKLRELTDREEDSNGTENPSEVPHFLPKHKNDVRRKSIDKQDLTKCHKCCSRKKKRAHKSCENLSKKVESISNSLLHSRSLDKLTDLEKFEDENKNRLHKNLDFQRVVDISQDIIDGIHFQKPVAKNCNECQAGLGLNYLRKNGCKSLSELNRISLMKLDKCNTYKSFEDNACEWKSDEDINKTKVIGNDLSKLPVFIDERASNSEDNILTSRLQQIIKKNKIYAVRSILKTSQNHRSNEDTSNNRDSKVSVVSDYDRRPRSEESLLSIPWEADLSESRLKGRSSSEPRVKFKSYQVNSSRGQPSEDIGYEPLVDADGRYNFKEYLEQKYRFPLRSDGVPAALVITRPRRMSERDLPSRVLSEQNHNGDSRRSLNTHAPIQSSKSVPALNSGNNDLVHGGPMSSTPATHPITKHEVFNPGYSRTSSTNSIPQQAQQAQQGLRSKSSQNLSDPRGANPQLPPTGLGSRQSSNPSLHHPQYPPGHPQAHTHPGTQSNQHPGHTGGQVGSGQQPNGEGERFYQNLSIYRNQEIHNGYPPPSPNRGKLPSPQGQDDRSPATAQVKGLRGSQSSLHNPPPNPANASTLRPASAYLPPSNSPAGYNGPQQMAARSQSSRDIGQEAPQGYNPQQMSARSQSSRDIMRQEAKLHEMQEEVRRREMRGVVSPQQYPVQPGPPPHTRPQMPAHLQQRVPNTTYPYSQDPNHPFAGPAPQYNGQRPPVAYAPPTAPKPVRHPSEPALNRPPNVYEQYRPQHGDLRHPPSEQYRPQMGPLPHTQTEQYRTHLAQQQELMRAQGESRVGFSPQERGQYATDGPGRPQMPHEEAGYRDSPPPPPPPTATHPLYQQKPTPPTGPQPDVRYSASSGEAPRGGFYPASPSSGGPPRQPFPFNSVATSPWEREEREKDQLRRREAARAWRDQQINELSSLAQRTAQQDEQLRALRLEREFQRRAEEAAKLEEEEEGEEEQESVERVQGLLRMATAAQNTPPKHPHILQNGRPNQPLSQPPRPPIVEDKERMRKVEEMRREQESKREHEMRRDQEIKREQEANKRREEEIRHHQHQLQQQQLLQQQQQQQMLQQQQLIQQQQQQQQQLKENFMASTQQQNQSSPLLRQPNNINSQFPAKPTNPSHLRLDNLVINGPSSPTTQYNGYNGSYQPEHKTMHGEGILKSPPQSPTESGAARLDSLLGVGERISQAPAPPERGSSFAVTQAVTQGVLRSGGRETSGIGTATVKRVSFSDPNANNQSLSPGGQPMERIREDPNHFINEAETLLASPKSPDGSPFSNNTPGVIGSQEVYKDPRARLLAAQQKLQLTRSGPLPEKLSFKEKMKMFAMETGEDGTPRDKA